MPVPVDMGKLAKYGVKGMACGAEHSCAIDGKGADMLAFARRDSFCISATLRSPQARGMFGSGARELTDSSASEIQSG